jgi:hypothetical protein
MLCRDTMRAAFLAARDPEKQAKMNLIEEI